MKQRAIITVTFKVLALITQAKNADVDVSKVTDKQIHTAEEALETVMVEKLGELDFTGELI